VGVGGVWVGGGEGVQVGKARSWLRLDFFAWLAEPHG